MFDNNLILLSICISVCYVFVTSVVSVVSQTYLPYGEEYFFLPLCSHRDGSITSVVFYAFMSKGASLHLSGFGRHITRMAAISCNRSKVAAVRNRRRGAYHGSRSTPRCFVMSSILFAAFRGRGRSHHRVFSFRAPAHHRAVYAPCLRYHHPAFMCLGKIIILCTCGILLICYCR